MTEKRRLTSRDWYPCLGCTKRYRACQDTCPDMLKAKKANDDRKATERQKRYTENSATEYCIERQLKAQRKKLKER